VKKILPLIVVSLLATPAMAKPNDVALAPQPVVAVAGKMLVDANGGRLAPVYRVLGDGSALILFSGRAVTVPTSTISIVNGKLTTSLKKADIIASR
jgi:hypothetical protein